jgi:hypothetical protein
LFTRARIALLRGRRELALDLFEQAVAAGYWPQLQLMPEWEIVRDEPRFQAIKADVEAEFARIRAEFAARRAAGA